MWPNHRLLIIDPVIIDILSTPWPQRWGNNYPRALCPSKRLLKLSSLAYYWLEPHSWGYRLRVHQSKAIDTFIIDISLILAAMLGLHSSSCVPIRSYWHCHLWHLIGWSHTVGATDCVFINQMLLTLSLLASYCLEPQRWDNYPRDMCPSTRLPKLSSLASYRLEPQRWGCRLWVHQSKAIDTFTFGISLILSAMLGLHSSSCVPIRCYWPCPYWHLIGWSHTVGATDCVFTNQRLLTLSLLASHWPEPQR